MAAGAPGLQLPRDYPTDPAALLASRTAAARDGGYAFNAGRSPSLAPGRNLAPGNDLAPSHGLAAGHRLAPGHRLAADRGLDSLAADASAAAAAAVAATALAAPALAATAEPFAAAVLTAVLAVFAVPQPGGVQGQVPEPLHVHQSKPQEVQEKDESQRPVQQGVRRVPQVRQPVRRQQHPRHWLVVVQAEHEHEICDGVSQGRLLQAKEEQEALHAQLWRMRVLRYS